MMFNLNETGLEPIKIKSYFKPNKWIILTFSFILPLPKSKEGVGLTFFRNSSYPTLPSLPLNGILFSPIPPPQLWATSSRFT